MSKYAVDFYTAQEHYFDHLINIWNFIPDYYKGKFFIDKTSRDRTVINKIRKHAKEMGCKVHEGFERNDNNPMVIAGFHNYAKIKKRPLILVNHGAGQSYINEKGEIHRAYAGGKNRDSTVLFLNPNYYANALDKKSYPNARCEVIGCPKMDKWHLKFLNGEIKQRSDPPVVAISFHFDLDIVPETKSAFPHFKSALKDLAKAKDYKILGHGHPRMQEKFKPHYEKYGIEFVENFEEILERADLFIQDHMSCLYEFASTGRPVVVLNAPWYRKDVEHGLRYWEHSDVGINCDHPDDLINCIKKALDDPIEQQRKREKAVNAVYTYRDGKATQRATEVITDFLDNYNKK